MYLKEVQIRNYKNFLKARFLFQKGVNVIIGENDSGKTNLMQAIRLVLDKRMDWREREIAEKMFPEMLENWQGHIIIISLRFAELNTTTLQLLKKSNAQGTFRSIISLQINPYERE